MNKNQRKNLLEIVREVIPSDQRYQFLRDRDIPEYQIEQKIGEGYGIDDVFEEHLETMSYSELQDLTM